MLRRKLISIPDRCSDCSIDLTQSLSPFPEKMKAPRSVDLTLLIGEAKINILCPLLSQDFYRLAHRLVSFAVFGRGPLNHAVVNQVRCKQPAIRGLSNHGNRTPNLFRVALTPPTEPNPRGKTTHLRSRTQDSIIQGVDESEGSFNEFQ